MLLHRQLSLSLFSFVLMNHCATVWSGLSSLKWMQCNIMKKDNPFIGPFWAFSFLYFIPNS